MKRRFILPAAAALALVAAGCGSPEKQDAAHANQVDRSAPQVVAMPDDFPNVAIKCDGHGHRLYVTSNNNGNVPNLTVVEDSSCPGGAR
jgi:hypothetical protein